MKKRNKNVFLSIIILICFAFLPYNVILSKADVTTQENYELNQNIENTINNSINTFENENIINNNTNILGIENKINDDTNTFEIENTINTDVNSISNNQENINENIVTNTFNITDSTLKTNSTEKKESITFNNIAAINEESEATPIAETSLVSTLWDTNQYSAGTGTPLTTEGTEILGWQAETNKYLQIDPVVPADGNTYFISVIMPQEFYIVGSELALQAGYQSVEFTKNEDILINENTTLKLYGYSGITKYTLNNMGITGTIQLEVSYDVRLWDKQANSSITADGVKPIIITLSRKDSAGNITELNRVFVSKVTAGTGIVDSMSLQGMIQGETSYSNSLTVPKDKYITVFYEISDNELKSRRKFYPNATMTIKLPYYTHTDGTKYYIPFDQDSLKFPGMSFSSKAVDTTKLESDGIITITFTNAYWNTSKVVQFIVGPPTDEILALDVNSYRFANGNITIMVDGKNGSKGIRYSSTNMIIANYQKEVLEKVSLSSSSRAVTIVERPNEAVSLLGGFYLKNTGIGDSCAKTIDMTFDIKNTNKIRVTTVNTFADTLQEYILINYTLVDENGEIVYLDSEGNRVTAQTEGAISQWTYNMKNSYYGSTEKSNLRNKFVRSMLPSSQKKYYFKTINYTIKTIEAHASLQQNSASATLVAAGNFLGYVDDKNGISGDISQSSMVVSSENISIADLKATSTTTLRDTSNPTYTIDNLNMNKTSIRAGESLTVSGRLNAVTYPYGNSTWIKNITLAAVLPKEISINEQSVVIKNVNGTKINGFSITSENISDGNKLWKIRFPSDIYIGAATENLNNFSSGLRITFSMQLDTAYTMNSTTLYAKDIFFAAAYKQTNSADGSYAWAKTTDIYDLNENGSKTDAIARASTTVTKSCQISSETSTLDINDSISIERQGTVISDSNDGYLLSDKDIVHYNLDIGCFSGGRAENVSYYIPIPKKSSKVDNFLIKQSSTRNFDFILKEPVSISGNDLFNIEYSFEEGLNYIEAQEATDWYTQDDIENDSSLNIQDVTIIKLTVKDVGIQNGNQTRITAKLLYEGEKYLEETGFENIWHSGGFYKYISGDRETAGNYITPGIKMSIKNIVECDDITLTAAKNMTPNITGNVNEFVVEKSSFVNFENSHDLSLISVETYNVTLQTKDYILANTGMSGIEANKTFAISVKTENEEELDILSSITAENPIKVGKCEQKDSPEFTYKIYNADSLTDNSQTRYIVLTYQSDNGLTIKQKININREIAGASDPKSAIVAGKRYLNYDDTTTEVTISENSAFTAQFIVEYIPDNYSGQSFEFSDKLPNGTTLVLGNLSTNETPTYWYYEVGTDEKSTFNFTDFNLMGKTSSDKYKLPTGIDVIEERLLLIVDFSEVKNYLEEKSYAVKMKLGGNTSIEDFLTDDMLFTTKKVSEFTLDDIQNVNLGTKFNVGYSANLSLGAESTYEGRRLSLILKAPNNIMQDTSLTVNGSTTYYLNSENEFIIPLTDIKNIKSTIELELLSNTPIYNSESYEFEASLWVSATANFEAPKFGEKVSSKTFTLNVENFKNPSLKVTNMNTRIIHRKDLSETFSTTYEYIAAKNCSITVELQKKNGAAYQKMTDKLNKVNNTTVHDMGIFNLTAKEGINTINFNLSSTTENNTYRLVFKVLDENSTKILEIPYNFIVID